MTPPTSILDERTRAVTGGSLGRERIHRRTDDEPLRLARDGRPGHESDRCDRPYWTRKAGEKGPDACVFGTMYGPKRFRKLIKALFGGPVVQMHRISRLFSLTLALILVTPARAMVSTTTSAIEYTCNGTMKVFTVPFRFLAQEHLRVSRVLLAAPYTETVLPIVSSYAVGGTGSATGGTVSLVTPSTGCATGYKLRIRHLTPRTQGTALSMRGPFNPQALEAMVDRQTMIAQELNDGSLIGNRSFDFTVRGPPDTALVTANGGKVPRSLAERAADVVNVKDFGAVGDGATNDTAAIQEAVAVGGDIVLPAGSYRWTAPIRVDGTKQLRIRGVPGATHVYCKDINGAAIRFTGNASNVRIDGIDFDGANGAGNAIAHASTTWTGLIQHDAKKLIHDLYISDARVRHSAATGAIALDLRDIFFAAVSRTDISHFVNGYGTQTGSNSTGVTTTLTFDKVYFHYTLVDVYLRGNSLNQAFRDCVFESSVIAIQAVMVQATFYDCYFENLGYDVASSRRTSPDLKHMGITAFSDLAAPIDTPIFAFYGQLLFVGCNFMGLNSISPPAAWFEGLGRGSMHAAGGGAQFINCQGPTKSPFFADTPDGARGDYQLHVHNAGGQARRMLGLMRDIRTLDTGYVFLRYNANDAEDVEVASGRVAMNKHRRRPIGEPHPTDPEGGAWVDGDRFLNANLSSGYVSRLYASGVWRGIEAVGPELTPASAPSFSPPGHHHATPQRVTITSKTDGAKIYYTLDGSVPSATSTLYSGPVTISGSRTRLRAFATGAGHTDSAITTQDYRSP